MGGLKGSALAAALLTVLTLSAQQVSALNVAEIDLYYGSVRTNGVQPHYYFQVEVKGTDINNVIFQDQTTLKWGTCTYDAGDNLWRYTDPVDYTDAAVYAANHANPTTYWFYLNSLGGGLYQDRAFINNVNIPAPTNFPVITYPLHNATDVELDPLYAWNSAAGFGNFLALGVVDDTGDTVYELVPEWNTARTTWPEPGLLAAGEDYMFMAAAVNVQAAALATVNSDPFAYYGFLGKGNQVGFTTAIPEPMSLLLLGTGFLILVGWHRRRRIA